MKNDKILTVDAVKMVRKIRDDSDIDLLVIMPELKNRRKTTVAMRKILADIPAPKDIIVTSKEEIKKNNFSRNNIFHIALKSVLVFEQIKIPKTHDLEFLLTLIPEKWNLNKLNCNLESLTEWAVESRYPSNWDEATEDDAVSAVRKCSNYR